jgi:hypothetical protein
MPWLQAPDTVDNPRSFRVVLWRNDANKPKLGFGQSEYKNWLNLPLSYLLWDIFSIKKYNHAYFEWVFRTQEELNTQLQDAMEAIIQYGIPWLEDINSKNPYPS